MIFRKALIISAILLLAACSAFADVTPNSLFSDGAVLQQAVVVPVWGTADEGEKVTVTVRRALSESGSGQGKVLQSRSCVAEHGKWMVRLDPMQPGGPLEITIQGKNTVTIHDVLVGEVWVCSGQSNMQWPLSATANAEADIAAASHPQIRLFTVPRNHSQSTAEDVNSKWERCMPETAAGFSAVGYFFGRDLQKALGVPVGLVNSSYGGTPAQAWTSREALDANPVLRSHYPVESGEQVNKNSPSVLYNAMIAPLQPYAIRGVIWYQGESNAGQAYLYRTLFPTMIRNWRETWGQGEFPFLFVQLAPFRDIVSEPQESAWAELREAQLLTSLNCPNTAMVVITDYGDPNDIHPKQKEPVGARLALAARGMVYGQDVLYEGPLYKSMEVWGDRAVVSFTNVGGGLEARGGELTGWTIAGEDGRFFSARASIQGDKVVVSSPNVRNPKYVRYGWADCPVVNLYNKEGLPASPFRTDDLPMMTAPRSNAE